MAQPDDMRIITDASNAQRFQNLPHAKISIAQSSPTLQGEASSWSPSSSPKLKKSIDYEDEGNHHNKKSVLTKVKEKAKKLRNSLSKKHNELRSPNTEEKEDPGYLGAPMYESELASDSYKQAANEHPQEAHTTPSEKHVVTSSIEPKKEKLLSSNNAITKAPSVVSANTMPKNSNHLPQSTGLKILASGGINNDESFESARGRSQTWDKGVSVKEYLMQKFEPGEDEKALSQVITQTLSPRREKMREAVNSLLKIEESSHSTTKISNAEIDLSTASSERNTGSNISNDSSNLSPNLGSNSSNPNRDLGLKVPCTYSNTNRSSLLHYLRSSTGDKASTANPNRVHFSSNANGARVSVPVTDKTRASASSSGHEVVEDENCRRILQAN